jgi:putative spermidine/putrescine transport system permease protein
MFKSFPYRLALGMVSLFILAPLLVIIPLAFTESEYLRVRGFTFSWLRTVLSDPEWVRAFLNSLAIAICSAAISVSIATAVNEYLRDKNKRLASVITSIAVIPSTMPAVVLAIALLRWYYAVNLENSILGLIFAHCILSLPLALLLLSHYSRGFFQDHPNIEAAAALMEVRKAKFFRQIILPNIRPAIFKAFLISAIISFNEGVIVQMVSGGQNMTLSKKLFDGLRFEVSPELAAVSLLLMLLCFIISIILYRVFKNVYASD